MDYTWQNEILMPRAENESAEAAVCAEISDKQLIELVLAGDEAAFEQIFERYKKMVAVIASRYFQDAEQIEEIIQISFAKVYFGLRNFRGCHDFSLASWLGKITTNACLDLLRKQKRRPENLLCELSDPEHESLLAHYQNAEKALVERDLAEKLLSRLASEDRAILQMLEAEEMSVGEVAAVTGWSKSKVKIRAFRARNALRKILRKFL
jgi:RNA polymerase sigma-70 factor, ECF subfamily